MHPFILKIQEVFMKSISVKSRAISLAVVLFFQMYSAISGTVVNRNSPNTLSLQIPSNSMIAEEVVFFEGTVEGAREKARKESKFYFIEFYAKWCEPCKWMDEYTFKNTTLSGYVAKNYVPVKVDVENLDGFIWKQKYKVQYLPTIVVLNANGTLLGKYEKSLTADDLMRILKNHRSLPGETVSETTEIATAAVIPVKTNPSSTASAAFISVHNEPGLPKASEVKKAPNTKPAPGTAVNSKPGGAASTVPAAKPQLKPGGNQNEFRVQIGVYTDPTNVANLVSELKKTYSQTVQVFNLKNKETNSISYRITLGKFDSREEAAQFALTLKSKGITGVIKHISELEK
jgi:thiol-disulfide isomerase/thioredoxin